VAVPQGRYFIEYRDARTSLTALDGGAYQTDMRTGHAVEFAASSRQANNGEVVISALIDGAGKHTFSIRTDNLGVSDAEIVPVDLGTHGKREITWHARVTDTTTPWVAVLLKDGSLSGHAELSGVSKTE
jgi:hypothetical protein